MLPTGKLVYKTENTSLNYVNSAIEYVVSLGYYCSVTYEGHLRYDNLPEAVFILTPESGSSFISAEQYQSWTDATSQDIPVYIIYRRKDTNELNVYTASVKKLRNDSGNNYAKIDNFKRTEFESYYEGNPKIVLKQLGNGVPLNPYDPDNYDEVIELYNPEELLLII